MTISLTRELKKSKVDLLYAMQEKQKRLSSELFYNFFRMSWSIVWPKISFKDNWHYEVLCNELQYQVERINEGNKKEYDILINVPPRTAKSTITSIDLPPWTWINYPNIKFIFGSCNEKLSYDHSVRSRRLTKSDWYISTFRPDWKLSHDQDMKGHFENDEGGYRIATSVGGSIGFGADIFVVDDPLSREDALSGAKRDTANEWMKETVPTRLNDPEISILILVMQRLHEEDTTGDILEREGKRWKHFCFPSEDSYSVKPMKYKSKYVNGVMFPDRHPKKVLKTFRVRLGSFTYSSQMGQDPLPPEGNLFKKHWWNYWKPAGINLPSISHKLINGKIHTSKIITIPQEFDNIVLSGDMTFKNTEGTDRVSLQSWASVETDQFLLDQILGQMDFIETIANCKLLYKNFSDATAFLVEDKANGPAVINSLENQIDILISVNPLGSKQSRVVDSSKAMSMVAQCEAGHLYLPHPMLAVAKRKDKEGLEYNWVDEFIREYGIFPKGRYDDQVDAGSQANARLTIESDFGLFTTSQVDEEDEEETIETEYTHDGSGYVNNEK